MNKLIYLAGAYSHPEEYIRQQRFERLTYISAHMYKIGICNISPITNSHICTKYYHPGLPGAWEFWKDIDEIILSKCDEIWVYTDPSFAWTASVGVQGECEYAEAHDIPIRYITDSTILNNFEQIIGGI